MAANIEGMDVLLNTLRQVTPQAARIEKKALETAADFVKNKAQDYVPVKTGKLSQNIIKSDVKDNQVHIGPSGDGFYGLFLELGTSKMSAQPFMGKVIDAHKGEIENILKNEIRRELGLQ